MKLTNPHSRVLTIAATGQTVEPGATVDIDDPAIAQSLLEQGWPEAKKPKTTSPVED